MTAEQTPHDQGHGAAHHRAVTPPHPHVGSHHLAFRSSVTPSRQPAGRRVELLTPLFGQSPTDRAGPGRCGPFRSHPVGGVACQEVVPSGGAPSRRQQEWCRRQRAEVDPWMPAPPERVARVGRRCRLMGGRSAGDALPRWDASMPSAMFPSWFSVFFVDPRQQVGQPVADAAADLHCSRPVAAAAGSPRAQGGGRRRCGLGEHGSSRQVFPGAPRGRRPTSTVPASEAPSRLKNGAKV